MMKTNPLGVVLALILVISALATTGSIFTYVRSAQRLQPLQTEVAIIKRNQAALQGLLSEAIEYGKRDASIQPLLESMGIRARTNVATPAAR